MTPTATLTGRVWVAAVRAGSVPSSEINDAIKRSGGTITGLASDMGLSRATIYTALSDGGYVLDSLTTVSGPRRGKR